MTDFFADLENHLRDAAARENARRGRFRLPVPSLRAAPALAMACVVAAVMAIAVVAAGGGSDERAAAPSPQPTGTLGPSDMPCKHRVIDGEWELVRDRYPIIARAAGDGDRLPHGLQQTLPRNVMAYSPEAAREAGESNGRRLFVMPALVLPPGQTVDDCSAENPAVPGLCLVTTAGAACDLYEQSTIGRIRIAFDGYLAGLIPRGAVNVAIEGAGEFAVEDNVFRGPHSGSRELALEAPVHVTTR